MTEVGPAGSDLLIMQSALLSLPLTATALDRLVLIPIGTSATYRAGRFNESESAGDGHSSCSNTKRSVNVVKRLISLVAFPFRATAVMLKCGT